MSKNKFLITQSLLSSWNWAYKTEDGHEAFLDTLNRKPIQKTSAMLNGTHFENMVTAYCGGSEIITSHKWMQCVQDVGDIVKGGAFQVKLSKNMIINNVEFVLYGILDVLKRGKIYDIKFVEKYYRGKYLDSPQHPMYFELCPEADEFTYLISDGKDVFTESYFREDITPIGEEIKGFMKYLDDRKLVNLYCEKWESKY